MLAQLQKRPINAISKQQCIQVYKGSIISRHMTGSLLESLTDKRGNAVKTSLTSADNQTAWSGTGNYHTFTLRRHLMVLQNNTEIK